MLLPSRLYPRTQGAKTSLSNQSNGKGNQRQLFKFMEQTEDRDRKGETEMHRVEDTKHVTSCWRRPHICHTCNCLTWCCGEPCGGATHCEWLSRWRSGASERRYSAVSLSSAATSCHRHKGPLAPSTKAGGRLILETKWSHAILVALSGRATSFSTRSSANWLFSDFFIGLLAPSGGWRQASKGHNLGKLQYDCSAAGILTGILTCPGLTLTRSSPREVATCARRLASRTVHSFTFYYIALTASNPSSPSLWSPLHTHSFCFTFHSPSYSFFSFSLFSFLFVFFLSPFSASLPSLSLCSLPHFLHVIVYFFPPRCHLSTVSRQSVRAVANFTKENICLSTKGLVDW